MHPAYFCICEFLKQELFWEKPNVCWINFFSVLARIINSSSVTNFISVNYGS